MKNRICTELQLPDEIEKYFIGTFYDISVDDGGKNARSDFGYREKKQV